MAAVVCRRRDLAQLPEPRALYVTPLWLRRIIGAVGVVTGVLSSGLVLKGLQAQGVDAFAVVSGMLLFVPCVWFVFLTPLADWRAWIQLAATPEGLYLAGKEETAVFLPWADVTGIAVETYSGKGGVQTVAALTLRLGAAADHLGQFQGVARPGPIATYRPPRLALTGAELAEELKAWRAQAV